jgi:GNAT superfamily N-acetyltransferase
VTEEIRLVPYADPLAQGMVTEALGDLSGRYGGDGDGTPVAPGEFTPPDGAFLVAVLDGVPVGCVGWRSHGGDGSTAELKRLYTAPAVRGRGLARRLLAAAEESARTHGRKRMILECGDRQPEAIALYESSGYDRIEDFGFYRGYASVRSFGRDL